MNYLALLVATYAALMPVGHQQIPQVLISIAQCESGLQQFTSNGNLVTNPTSGAFGIFQDLPSHKKQAYVMGLDLTDPVEHIQYNIWLFNRYGTSPWLASKGCWGKSNLAVNAP